MVSSMKPRKTTTLRMNVKMPTNWLLLIIKAEDSSEIVVKSNKNICIVFPLSIARF